MILRGVFSLLFGLNALAFAGEPTRPPPAKVIHAPYELVDLHAHLFMDRGMGFMMDGDFRSPLKSNDWADRFSSQINEATMESSNLGLLVVSLYAHPVFAPSRQGSIRAQIQDAKNFVAKYPDWVIAKTPAEARAAHAAGKRILIFSLEGAAGILDTEADFKEFIDKEGIRIVTFAHLSNDHLTGAAFMSGYKKISSPGSFVRFLFSPTRDCDGTALNPEGLSDDGRRVARALIARHVWIDLSHAPEASQAELIPMMKKAGQPLIFTHIGLRSHAFGEFSLTPSNIQAVKDTGGIVGLVVSDEAIKHAEFPFDQCPLRCQGKKKGNCKGGVWSLAAEYQELAQQVGPESVFLGSDFNGSANHLPPTGCRPVFSIDGKRGMYNIGQTSELWATLREAGAPVASTSHHGVENFIETWEKLWTAPAP